MRAIVLSQGATTHVMLSKLVMKSFQIEILKYALVGINFDLNM
jgi:hypothetical protein